ncbi:hypothetical protein OKW96_19230 [Sphingobacterium sp. KU25419]|nr:hypothetical protein OKW96_19230 [Sphingobacterium sp. KU25419]
MGWKKLTKEPEGTFLIVNNSKRKGNPRSLKVHNPKGIQLGLQNEGFRGMGVKKGEQYEFSLLFKQASAGMRIRVDMLNEQDKVIGTSNLTLSSGSDWQSGSSKFTVSETAAKGKLNVWIEGSGDAELDMISLFPSETWKNRPKGLRKDMVQMLADMKPGFIRFPGGCIVEGRDLASRFQWKKNRRTD